MPHSESLLENGTEVNIHKVSGVVRTPLCVGHLEGSRPGDVSGLFRSQDSGAWLMFISIFPLFEICVVYVYSVFVVLCEKNILAMREQTELLTRVIEAGRQAVIGLTRRVSAVYVDDDILLIANDTYSWRPICAAVVMRRRDSLPKGS